MLAHSFTIPEASEFLEAVHFELLILTETVDSGQTEFPEVNIKDLAHLSLIIEEKFADLIRQGGWQELIHNHHALKFRGFTNFSTQMKLSK